VLRQAGAAEPVPYRRELNAKRHAVCRPNGAGFQFPTHCNFQKQDHAGGRRSAFATLIWQKYTGHNFKGILHLKRITHKNL